jgi:hypothetical protein
MNWKKKGRIEKANKYQQTQQLKKAKHSER